jgi:hypothetical protein
MSRRPRYLTLFLLLLCVANVAGAGLAVKQALELPDLPTSLPPVYIAVMCGVWAVAFGTCACGAAMVQAWTTGVTLIVSLLYQVNIWINRLAFGRSSESFDTIGFHVLLSAATLAFTFALLFWPPTRRALQNSGRSAGSAPTANS